MRPYPSGSHKTSRNAWWLQKDTISGTALLLLSVGYFILAMRLPSGRQEPGPGFLPAVYAGLLAVIALVILAKSVTRRDTTTPPPVTTTDHDGGGEGPGRDHVDGAGRRLWAAPWLAVIFTFGYAALFIPLGFVISTLLYTLALTWLFGRGRLWYLILVPPATTAVIYALFRLLLGARLPSGPFS